MTEGMPKKLPPNVYREVNRHGNIVTYYRVGHGPRIRLPNDPNSAEFKRKYQMILAGSVVADDVPPVAPRSLRWLVERYKESAAWVQLSPSTRYRRDLLFLKAIEASKNADYRAIDRKTIQKAVDKRAGTPEQANYFLKVMRGLFAWALKGEHVTVNPCIGVERIKHKSDGFPPWTPEDVVAYRDRHAVGTKQRLAMEFMLLTGIRRGDMATAGRQHIRNGVFTMRTKKTGAVVTVEIPAYLSRIIEATAMAGMHLISQANGKPYTVESFGNNFRDWCNEAGVTKSAHGLRKLSATLAAEGGSESHALMAQYGWSNMSQAELYTKSANRARLGKRNSAIVAEQIGNIILPHLTPGAGDDSLEPEENKAS